MDTLPQIAPLQLEGYYIKELAFRIRDDLDEKLNTKMQLGVGLQLDGLFNPDPLTVNITSGMAAHLEDPYRWKCEVRIESQNPPERNYPYDFLAVLVGFFKADERMSSEHAQTLIAVNGASVLYSAGRDILATVTARGPFPHVLLPTVAFIPQVEQAQEQPAPAKELGGANGKRASKKGAKKKGAKKARK